jgi:diaminopimelate epimerase
MPQKSLRFWKMNGCGNSFAIIDGRTTSTHPSPERIRDIALQTRADQVIVIEPANPPRDVFMRIWNADGSEVSACGNATRCVAHIVMEETGLPRTVVQTRADSLHASRTEGGLITVDMGVPKQKWSDIPVRFDMDVKALTLHGEAARAAGLPAPHGVSMGNPHAVFFVQDVSAINIPHLGPLIEHDPIFPERANVGFAQVTNWRQIRLRVWERGAGLTLACGTGACAAVVCAARAGITDRRARVLLDGGELRIHWREDDDRVHMTGPIELEYTREIPV